jgi:hypothetical protein
VLTEIFCDFFTVLTDQVHLGAQRPEVIENKKGIHRRKRGSIIPVRKILHVFCKAFFK